LKPWHVTNPGFLCDIRAQLKKEYPTLHVVIDGGCVHIRGCLPIRNADGTSVLDRFTIDVLLPTNFPIAAPLVREVGGRVPHTADRHVNPDGTACLFARPESARYWSPSSTLTAFIRGPVTRFFEGQSYFELTGEPLYGERPHGSAGILDYYEEEVGSTDVRVVRRFLLHLISPRLRGDLVCYCGSNRALSRCHQAKVVRLRARVSPAEALRDYCEVRRLSAGGQEPPTGLA